MALAPILQIRRMVANRSSVDVSIGYFLVLIVGFGLWVAYGVSLGNLVLIVPNSVALVVAITAIAVARHYRTSD